MKMGRRQRRNLAKKAANARWSKAVESFTTSGFAETPETYPITSDLKAAIPIATNPTSSSAVITSSERSGDGNMESDIEVKEIHCDSHDDDDISAERQGDGNMESEENTDDGDISDDDSHHGDPDYVPPVEIGNDDLPDSNGLFPGELSLLRDLIAFTSSNAACMTPSGEGKLVCTALGWVVQLICPLHVMIVMTDKHFKVLLGTNLIQADQIKLQDSCYKLHS